MGSNISLAKEKLLSRINELEEIIDTEGLIFDLDYELSQVLYFHKYIQPKSSRYQIENRPKEHTVAYFNLTRGFPQEVAGGHWCFILNYVNDKAVVIPLTSIKEYSLPVNSKFQLDIEVEGFLSKSRLQISDTRTVDIQRCYVRKGYRRVITSTQQIISKISDVLLSAS